MTLIRAFFRPTRAVVKEGKVFRCAGGTNSFGVCDPSDVIETSVGDAVFSTAPARVVSVGGDYVNLVVMNEPVILMYSGVAPSVSEGQHVGTGQKIGISGGRVTFSVTQYKQGMASEFVVPSAWLAVRGQRLVRKDTGSGDAYCAGGREIVVPDGVGAGCNLKLPTKAGFALLPVTVERE